MTSAEVVIVGGGVIGASVAYHLARAGCRDVLVLDRGAPGEGSTGRATGGFRAQFASEINVRLSLLSRDELRLFRDETGIDPDFDPCGYLFVAREPATLAAFAEILELQRRVGLDDVTLLDVDGVRAANPQLRLDGVVGGVFGAGDGTIRPLRILDGYRRAAERLGVRFAYGTGCTGVGLDGDRVDIVKTRSGSVAAGSVVNAAGPWAREVAGHAGIDLPVHPLRRQVALTERMDPLPPALPLTIFAEDGFHFRVRDDRMLLLWPDDPPADPWSTAVDRSWFDRTVARARAELPALEATPIDFESCWAGLYEMSPDGHVLLGPAPGLANLYLVNGSSGHGVMHAPALGQLCAEIILDGCAHSIDVHPLRPERFEQGEPNLASVLL